MDGVAIGLAFSIERKQKSTVRNVGVEKSTYFAYQLHSARNDDM